MTEWIKQIKSKIFKTVSQEYKMAYKTIYITYWIMYH